ncbi:MAG: nucleotide exchange factor GrpE [Bacteroidetes bacterium]|nr:MAG: nucleotide exchange factor GrpE [Bacteroidota bacterium]RLD72923.1 MAG: nucleotide exchange factor GrpE [Bacteroidota bacterium]RLD87719.1 MAG: nucleotide exchange factor GrpE [Bacteroidota bacterium]
MTKKSEKADNQQSRKIKVEEPVKQEEAKKELEQEETADEAEAEEKEEPKKEPTAEEKLAELQDRYLRLSAEYDNFRKRTLKEKIDLQKSANENLLEAILPVADDFDRAMQSVDDAKDIKAVKEGMRLISGKFNGFLNQQGVKEIEAVNKEFDTDLHEAITKIPAPSKKLKGKVVDVIQKGYFLNDKVLRFSKVVIGE